jgi:hypothetical protein
MHSRQPSPTNKSSHKLSKIGETGKTIKILTPWRCRKIVKFPYRRKTADKCGFYEFSEYLPLLSLAQNL